MNVQLPAPTPPRLPRLPLPGSRSRSPRGKQATRLNGTKVALDTFLRGLRTDGLIVRGGDGADISRFKFRGRTVFILRSPEYVDQVLHGSVERYHKSVEYEMLRAALGLSLFTDEDESWRRHRMLVNPVMAKRHLEAMFDLMLEPIETMLAEIDDGSDRIEIEMTEAMTELTLDVVGSALFGRGMADLAKRIGPTVTQGLRAAERATRVIVLTNPPAWLARAVADGVRHIPVLPPPLSRLHGILETVDDTVWSVINERRGQPEHADDLLGLLLSVRDEDGERLPLRRVRDEAATFMLAGHETTANALSWMWYLLSLPPNRDARERMLAEVDEVLGDRRPTYEDAAKLEWTTACFMEAMRAYSPAWVIPRVCISEDVIDGHRIPKGATVLIPIDALHHDERYWDRPDVYDPARFLPENAKSIHRSAYLPFGGGRRVCAGKSFAVLEGALVTAMFSRRFTYDVAAGHRVEPEATLTLRPRYGIRMIASRREPVAAAMEAAA